MGRLIKVVLNSKANIDYTVAYLFIDAIAALVIFFRLSFLFIPSGDLASKHVAFEQNMMCCRCSN